MCATRYLQLASFMFVWASLGANAGSAADMSPAEARLAKASAEQQYTYLMFFRSDDDATKTMRGTIEAQVEQTGGNTVFLPIKVSDAAESKLVAKYDATRTPLPVVMGIAPNGAVTGVYPLAVAPAQLERAVLTPKYSEMVKALQEQKIVVLCMQPANGGVTPKGISEFESLTQFKGRTHRITVQADDDSEARFFQRMKLSRDLGETRVMAFAPPGVYVGKWEANVRGATIGQAVHKSGRCNCSECQKHRR